MSSYFPQTQLQHTHTITNLRFAPHHNNSRTTCLTALFFLESSSPPRESNNLDSKTNAISEERMNERVRESNIRRCCHHDLDFLRVFRNSNCESAKRFIKLFQRPAFSVSPELLRSCFVDCENRSALSELNVDHAPCGNRYVPRSTKHAIPEISFQTLFMALYLLRLFHLA